MKALLVIDLQVCYLEQNFSPAEQERALANVNHAIERAQRERMPVIYLRHFFDNPIVKFVMKEFYHSAGVRGSQRTVLDPRLKIVGDLILEKNTANAFDSTNLDEILKSKNIDELYVTGLDGTACVQATSFGALEKGYKVDLVDDSIISASPRRWSRIERRLAKQPHCEVVASF